MKILIVGKNSKVYQDIKLSLLDFGQIYEVSHLEIKKYRNCFFDLCINFAVDKKNVQGNYDLFSSLKDMHIKKLYHVSSSSVNTLRFFPYSYPVIKLIQEYYVQQYFKNYLIIRLPTYKSYSDVIRCPNIFCSRSDLLSLVSSHHLFLDSKIIEVKGELLNTQSKFNSLYVRFILFFTFFMRVRLLDLFLKIFTNKNYGYSALLYFLNSEKK